MSDGNDTPPIPHLSLPDTVRLTLRRRIINNELPAGTRLLEVRLAEEFGVSRTTLRSALRELKSDGLVKIEPRRGAFVARMDYDQVQDICFTRYVLEAGAAAELRADQTMTIALNGVLEEMVAAAEVEDLEAIVEADTRLHGMIVEAGGRQRVIDLWHGLDGQMGSVMRSSFEHQGIDLDEIVMRHRPLVDAIATHRPTTITKAIRHHYLYSGPVHHLDDHQTAARPDQDGT